MLTPFTGDRSYRRCTPSQCAKGFFIVPCLQPVPGGNVSVEGVGGDSLTSFGETKIMTSGRNKLRPLVGDVKLASRQIKKI